MNDKQTLIAKNLLYIPALFIGFPTVKILILSYLIIIDIISGIMASYRVDGGKSITSRKMASGILAKLVVLVIPITLFILSKGLVNIDVSFLISATISGLMLAEAYSIIGNVQMVRTGKRVKEFDAINLVIQGIRSGLEKLVRKDRDKTEK